MKILQFLVIILIAKATQSTTQLFSTIITVKMLKTLPFFINGHHKEIKEKVI